MYARSTTIRGTAEKIHDGIAYVHDTVMHAVREMEGCLGLSMLADHKSGRCIVTSSWSDRDAMLRSADGVMDMRRRTAEILGGPAEVQEWEIALMHRLHSAHRGACARVIWTEGDPAGVEDTLDAFRKKVLPQLDDLAGCCSVSVLLDRTRGHAVVTTTYDSPLDMKAARDRAQAIRQEFMEQMHRPITEVREFDLPIAHLRVPETV